MKKKFYNPISFVTRDRLRRFGTDYCFLSLYKWLKNYFPARGEIDAVMKKYNVLTDLNTDENGCNGTVWPFRDEYGKIRKVLETWYDPYSGEVIRMRDISRELAKGYTLQATPTLFGMHLLDKYPDLPVVIVERPQDAVILSLDDSKSIYLALGGNMNLQCDLTKREVLAPLQGRTVILSPCLGGYDMAVRLAEKMNRAGVQTSVENPTYDYVGPNVVTKGDLLIKAIEDEQFFASDPFDHAPLPDDPGSRELIEWLDSQQVDDMPF